jgi:hypothetical protein
MPLIHTLSLGGSPIPTDEEEQNQAPGPFSISFSLILVMVMVMVVMKMKMVMVVVVMLLSLFRYVFNPSVSLQALQLALHATWIAGLLCIFVSLYATQLLTVEQRWKKTGGNPLSSSLKLEMRVSLFSVPAPFHGMVGAAQERAISSWLRLSPHIRVILIGKHPSLMSIAQKMMASSGDSRIFVESDIDFTYRKLYLLIPGGTFVQFCFLSVLAPSSFVSFVGACTECFLGCLAFSRIWIQIRPA